jgi:hypothetical protein
MPSQLLPFMGAAILTALTPGADTALVVRNALAAGAPAVPRHRRRPHRARGAPRTDAALTVATSARASSGTASAPTTNVGRSSV